MDALKDHPAVKRVTAQRMVIRHLHFVNDTDEDTSTDLWDEILFANISETGDGFMVYNISEAQQEDGLHKEEDIDGDDTAELDVEYEVLGEEYDKKEVKEGEDDSPCSGKDCPHSVKREAVWPASRPFRRSSLTLVGTYQCK